MKIATSILNSDNRIESVLNLNRTNTSYIHVDVMDGRFVEDIQFNVNEISAVNRVTKYPMDIHLMVNDPISYIVKLKDMNIEYITFHLEIRKNKEKVISKIKECGYKVGISIKPDTNLEEIMPYLKNIDLVLVMSVEPGKGGQEFLDKTVDRVLKLKKIIDENNYNIKIEVDGGINDKTITKLNGVDIAVVGSYIIKSDNYYNRINSLLDLCNTCVETQYDKVDLKKKLFINKVLFFIGILPFIFLLCNSVYKSIVGSTRGCFWMCEKKYGLEVFIDEFMLGLTILWPLYLVGLLFIIYSVVRLVKLKRLSK